MSVFNADLIDDVARQRVVLFLGAGVSSSATTRSGARIKGWEGFLRDMCLQVDGELRTQISGLLDKKDYLLACELLQAALSEAWEGHVTREFGQMAEPSALHKAIVALDQRIILTTNFDKIIEACWENKLGTSTHLPVILPSISPKIFKLLKDHSNKYLVKIHGTVDNADTLIFSRSEYIRLAFGSASYSSFIETLLLNYTFLFIGFSMDDPAVCSLMEMYALRYENARPHYIFTAEGLPTNIMEINRKLRKLVAITYDPANNHAQLPDLILKLSELSRVQRRAIFASMLADGTASANADVAVEDQGQIAEL
ncbi:SIR2 family protein [Methylobacterium sp. C33D]